MKSCREARELIHAECDGEVGAQERAALRDHLRTCDACRRYQSAMAALRTRVREAASVPSDADELFARLMKTVGPDPSDSSVAPSWIRSLQPAFIRAAAAAVLLAAGIFGFIAMLAPTPSAASMIEKYHRLRLVGALMLDTHANCCKDLEEWFEAKTGRPVRVPDITYEGVLMDGGTLYSHSTGNTIFVAAYTLGSSPVTVCVCSGPNMRLGDAGEPFTSGGRTARLLAGPDYTMISWREGLQVTALITPFDAEKSKAIFAATK